MDFLGEKFRILLEMRTINVLEQIPSQSPFPIFFSQFLKTPLSPSNKGGRSINFSQSLLLLSL